MKKGLVVNVAVAAREGTHYREVRYTGAHLQLVFMSLKKNEEIGEEAHGGDQFIRVESGAALVVTGGEEYALSAGEAALIPGGAPHNVINMGDDELKLSTLYAPPEHKEGTIHRDKPSEIEERFEGETAEKGD